MHKNMSRCLETLTGVLIVTFWWRGVLGDSSWWDRHKDSISCEKPGYFVNQADCHSFFRCVDKSTWDKPTLQRYDFTCPDGMVFDPAVSVCTNPGPNGCADPWWPGKGEGSESGGTTGPSGAGDESSSGGASSLEGLPSIFSSSRRPSGGGRPGSPGDGQFGGGRPGSPGGGQFGGGRPGSPGGGQFDGSDGDPLDTEFGGSPSRPNTGGSSGNGGNGGSLGNGGGGGSFGEDDPLDTEFGSSSSPSSNSVGGRPGRPSSGSNTIPPKYREPGSRLDLFDGNSNTDPLDDEFGFSPGNADGESGGSTTTSEKPPSFSSSSSSSKPGSRPSPFRDSNPGVRRDPLEIDFGTPSRSLGPVQTTTKRPNSGRDNNPGGLRDCSPNCNRNQGNGAKPGSSNPDQNWWGSNTDPSSNWNRNENPNSVEFDPWGSRVSPGSSPGAPGRQRNWGGASRPSNPTFSGNSASFPNSPFDNGGDSSPWRPSGPWGAAGSSNELDIGSPSSPSIPESPSHPPPFSPNPPTDPSFSPPPNRPHSPSWWDPPYAMPYQPPGAGPAPPPNPYRPPPGHWDYRYRPRYPYQAVAYPMWPSPPNNRTPVVVVYSNSRK